MVMSYEELSFSRFINSTAVPSIESGGNVSSSKSTKKRRGPPCDPLSLEKVNAKQATSITNYEICELRTQVAAKNVKIEQLTSQIAQQKTDFQKQQFDERKKFETAIKAVLAKQKSLEKTVERQRKRLEKGSLDQQVTKSKLLKSRNEIKRLSDLVISISDNDGPPKKKANMISLEELECHEPNVAEWSSDSE
jgi:hypothetical protein